MISVFALLAAVVAAAAARADGLPVLGVDVGAIGVPSPTHDSRYVTLPAGSATVLARVRSNGGQVISSQLLRGRFTVPAVAPEEQMRGRPLTRASDPKRRWAYTLYDGAGKTPFLHALDTGRRSARCIDLAGLPRRDLSRLRLAVDAKARRIVVHRGLERLVVIDARTFRVSAVR